MSSRAAPPLPPRPPAAPARLSAALPARPPAALALLLALAGCGTTGAEPFAYPIAAVGVGAEAFAVGDWQVTLTRADVALGPIYLCATAAASPDLCAVAVGEFADVAVLDALAPDPAPLGEVAAVAGDVRSAMLDYGISWFTTRTEAAADSPLGHSARLVGVAVRGAATVEFDAQVDVLPPLRGSPALLGVRARADAPDADSRLLLRVDPRAWLRTVDFDALAAAGPTATLRPGDPDHAAIAFAMTTQPPAFAWSDE